MALPTRNTLLLVIRNALELDDATMTEIFGLTGRAVTPATLAGLLTPENHDGHIPCSDPMLAFFLDGLIIHRRGAPPSGATKEAIPCLSLSNNVILKKLRIALDLKEDELQAIMERGGARLSKHELSALFRKEGNKHFRECADQVLASFLEGVALRR